MNRDILHKYWMNNRHAQVLYDNDLKMFVVEMYKKTKYGMKKVVTKPIGKEVFDGEQLAEDTAEDWVHKVLNYPLPKEYVNDN
tara:strand:+ start:2427 stop:2675 length:249 start_codon:yes stop_codon:yes gene_type:complete